MKIIAQGRIEDTGKLHIYNRKQFLEDIRTFLGKEVILTVEKKKRKRTLLQNAYLFGYMYRAVQEGLKDMTGEKYTIEQIHEMFKAMFLKNEIMNKETGETATIPGSTATLSTSEFMFYIEEITKWSAEWLHIIILQPGQQSRISY